LTNPTVFSGAQLASCAFAQIPFIGTPLLVLGMVSFSYSTILGWSYYGSRCITYLFGKHAILPYQIIYVAAAFLGAIGIGDVIWTISDITNALMAIPNIIMVLLFSGLVARETKYYVYDDHLEVEDKTPIPLVKSK
jgi:AGCS family alanine or glycine:cation symporter